MALKLAWAAAVSVGLLPVFYPAMGLAAVVRGCDPRRGYWRSRLVLNLLEAHLGMIFNLALAVTVAILLGQGSPLGWRAMVLAGVVDAVYALLVLALTPRDWWHAVPMLVAIVCYLAAGIVA